jgi:DNA-binding NarL/FixJ family response regulator
MEKIRVFVVDDHIVVRKGIRMIVDTEPSIQIVGEAENGQSAIRQVKSLQPDVVLMDLVMPGDGGIEAIAEIKRDHPHIKIIALTTFEDADRINAAMEAGADGYLLKDADGEALLQAIQAAQRGDMPLHPRIARYLFTGATKDIDTEDSVECLTEREKEVLKLVAKGWSNKDVAQVLNLSEGTVKVHVSNILGKLNLSSRTEAAVWAVRIGLIVPEEENNNSISHLA